MSHFHFPGFSTPAQTPGKPDTPEVDDYSRTPVSFMPQASSRMVLMSAASHRRSHKSTDERATRLLLEAPPQYDVEEESWDIDDEKSTLFDINDTPKTPPLTPLTPLTPTTDTSLPSLPLYVSVAFCTNIYEHMRMTSRRVALLAFAVLVLLFMAVIGVAGMKASTYQMASSLWNMMVAMSTALEMGIEGVGWALGRAVGRLGKGFEAGYRV